jgi:hypothetical protein
MTDAAGIGKLADAFAKVYECRGQIGNR